MVLSLESRSAISSLFGCSLSFSVTEPSVSCSLSPRPFAVGSRPFRLNATPPVRHDITYGVKICRPHHRLPFREAPGVLEVASSSGAGADLECSMLLLLDFRYAVRRVWSYRAHAVGGRGCLARSSVFGALCRASAFAALTVASSSEARRMVARWRAGFSFLTIASSVVCRAGHDARGVSALLATPVEEGQSP